MPAADLLELGRRGRCDELARQAEQARTAAGWDAAAALELATAWLLAGDPRRADLAYLEADQLAPGLGLVPDVWGLWPTPPASDEEAGPARAQLLALAKRWRGWRHADPQVLWQQLLPRLREDWRQALEPAIGDPLRILARASSHAGAAPLDPPLESELAKLVADAQIAAEPAASNRFWQLLATSRPGWGLARIRAADLALSRGELEVSVRLLQDPPAEVFSNPWFHDVAARQAVARGALDTALDAWADAIRSCQADPAMAALAELFEQRRREARRGPGVLQVRSLANRGERTAALMLLERLLTEDPQWQPLRSLREQLLSPPLAASSAANAQGFGTAGAATDGPTIPAGAAAAADAAASFEALLQRAEARLQALGHPIQATLEQQTAVGSNGPAALAEAIKALEQRLSDNEARFALA